MDSTERIALVNRMVGLVNQLYLLENCCPQLSCDTKSTTNTYSSPQNCARILNCVPHEPRNFPKNHPQHISHNCVITQPKSAPSINKSNVKNSCVHQKRKPKSYCTTIPKSDMTTTYRADYVNYRLPTTPSSAAASPYSSEMPKPCFMLKCQPHKCKAPNDEPLITWSPVLEIRKTTNAKNLERQNDDPLTKYVYVEPPGCPYQPVWSTKDPMCEQHCGPPPDCPALGPPSGYNGGPIELCCPGGKGPPVDRWGQPYECKQTLDGRAICKPTKEAGPTDWCDAKTTPFRKCDTKEESKRVLTRGKVLNQRFKTNTCIDKDNAKRTTSLYKRPVWPRKETCNDGRCRCPDNPGNQRKMTSRPIVQSRGLTLCCTDI